METGHDCHDHHDRGPLELPDAKKQRKEYEEAFKNPTWSSLSSESSSVNSSELIGVITPLPVPSESPPSPCKGMDMCFFIGWSTSWPAQLDREMLDRGIVNVTEVKIRSRLGATFVFDTADLAAGQRKLNPVPTSKDFPLRFEYSSSSSKDILRKAGEETSTPSSTPDTAGVPMPPKLEDYEPFLNTMKLDDSPFPPATDPDTEDEREIWKFLSDPPALPDSQHPDF